MNNSTHRRVRHNSIAGAVALALALSGLGVAGAASADPLRHCSTNGWVYKSLTTTVVPKRYVLTHDNGLHLSPGTSMSKTVTLDHTTTVTASVSASVALTTTAGNEVIGKVDAQVSGTLARDHSHTSTKSESVSQHFTARSNDSYYAVYDGVVSYSGKWHMDECSGVVKGKTLSGVLSSHSGTWKSYVNVSDSNALCRYGKTTRKSSYPAGSLAYQACTEIGWGAGM